MQSLGHGAIYGLRVDGAEPVLNPPPRVVRDVLLHDESRPKQTTKSHHFELKRQVEELLEVFDRERNCEFEVIEVKHGLPHRYRLVDQNAQRMLSTTE